LLRGFAGLCVTRVELGLVELEEEKLRVGMLLGMVGVVVVLGGLGLAMVTVALMLACPAEGRVVLALVLGLGYSGGAAFVYWYMRRWLRRSPSPFEETRKQFEKDREWFRDQG
jgi:uncharacterized membrane protein YqjE